MLTWPIEGNLINILIGVRIWNLSDCKLCCQQLNESSTKMTFYLPLLAVDFCALRLLAIRH